MDDTKKTDEQKTDIFLLKMAGRMVRDQQLSAEQQEAPDPFVSNITTSMGAPSNTEPPH
jgi:hypothetical protein